MAEASATAAPADGFTQITITGKINPAADAANRTLEFLTTEGSFVEAAAATPKSAEKAVDTAGEASVHLRTASVPGVAEVTVRVKAKPDIAKRITVTFTAADPSTTITLTPERSSAPADDFTATAIFAQLGGSVPQAGRSVVFTTTQGRFLQGTTTATVTADQNGRARVDLVGPQAPVVARVTAVAFGVTQELLFTFTPALPDLILVKPAKLSIQTGVGDAATTAVVIELYRNSGKVSTGLVPSIQAVDSVTGEVLPFLIRNVSPSAADGKSQAQITAGATTPRTARIEVRVDNAPTLGIALIEVVPVPPPPGS